MTCVRCGSAVSKTDEHVYARWMRKGIQAEARTTVTVGREDRFVRTDAGPTIVLRKGACRECNTGWMAALERQVQPLLLLAMSGEPAPGGLREWWSSRHHRAPGVTFRLRLPPTR